MKKIFQQPRCFAAAVIVGILLGFHADSSTASAEILEVNEKNFPDETLRSYLQEQSSRVQIASDGYGGTAKTYYIDTDEIDSLNLENISKMPDLSKLPKVTSVTFENYTGTAVDFKNSNVKNANIYQTAAADTLKIKGKKLKQLYLYVTGAVEGIDCSLPNLAYAEITGNDKIKEISGLEKSAKLTALRLFHFPNINSKSLPLEKLVKLKALALSDCGLSSLNIGKLEKLTWLDVSGNRLTSLNVSKLEKLTSLDVGSNQLTALDVSKLKHLVYLEASKNNITSLDVKNNRKLKNLYVDGNKKLKKLDVSNNKKLTGIDVGSTGLSKLDLKNNKKLSIIRCNDTKISTLNLNRNKHLDTIMYSGSRIKKLNLKKYSNLTIEYKANPGSTISFADFVGTGYTVLNNESSLLSYNSKKGSITVKNKKYKTRWNNITLQKGKKLLRIHIYMKKQGN